MSSRPWINSPLGCGCEDATWLSAKEDYQVFFALTQQHQLLSQPAPRVPELSITDLLLSIRPKLYTDWLSWGCDLMETGQFQTIFRLLARQHIAAVSVSTTWWGVDPGVTTRIVTPDYRMILI